MKKLLTAICTFALAILTAVTFAGCGSKANYTYVALTNNDTGFTVNNDDVSIAIGLKKDSTLLASVNTALNSIDAQTRTSIMQSMVALSNNTDATFTPSENAALVETNDTLKVAMECGYEPFNWTQNSDANGAVAIDGLAGKYANGYDVQIARIVANALGKKLVIVQSEWDALIPGLNAGTFNAIVAGMSPTAERKTQIDFSSYYYTSNLVVITKQGSKIANATTLAELDKAGVKIAAQPGTVHLDVLKDQTSKLTVVENLEDFPAMRVALDAGTIDGFVAEDPTAMAMVK